MSDSGNHQKRSRTVGSKRTEGTIAEIAEHVRSADRDQCGSRQCDKQHSRDAEQIANHGGGVCHQLRLYRNSGLAVRCASDSHRLQHGAKLSAILIQNPFA